MSTIIATGGQVTTEVIDNVTIVTHTFTTSDVFELNLPISVDYLIVAGGGSGGGTTGSGSNSGGGGGGGGVITASGEVISSGSYTILVGSGGAGTDGNGFNGNNSSGLGVIALGGGAGGGGASTINRNGQPGGSGGGGGISTSTGLGGSGTLGQGFAGGNSSIETGGGGNVTQGASGGGGGAGGSGVAGSGIIGGAGGIGLLVNITGVDVYYGGGGGGTARNNSGTIGLGGLGGGGDGARQTIGQNGSSNTGGGGGASSGNGIFGSDGGSGIVIIKYSLPPISLVLTSEEPIVVNPTINGVSFIPVLALGGNSANYTYSISPSLPEGLFYNQSTGEITGNTLISTIETEYTVTVTDGIDTETLTFLMSTSGLLPISSTVIEPVVNLNRFIENTGITPVTFEGGALPYVYSIQPSLPEGLQLDTTTGTILGQPLEPVIQDFEVIVTGGFNNTASGSFTLVATINLENPMLGVGGTEEFIDIKGIFYKSHTFKSSGVFTALTSGKVDYLIVGGGGGGGETIGGGGGAGEVKIGSFDLVEGDNIVLTVGAGGLGGDDGQTGVYPPGLGGSGSSLLYNDINISVLGGGGGGGYNINAVNTATQGGAHGGGQGAGGGLGGLPGAGFNAGGSSSSNTNSGAGGAGAGASALNSTSGSASFGGRGIEWPLQSNKFWAGGGGGGARDPNGGGGGLGGLGGGGLGGQGIIVGQNGAAGTGSGGGGGGFLSGVDGAGGNGGSGAIVFIYESVPPSIQTKTVIPRKIASKYEVSNFKPVITIGGELPFTFSIFPQLPAGLVLNPRTGFITGSPTESFLEKVFTITVSDSPLVGQPTTSSSSFILTTYNSYLNAIDLVVNRTLFIQTVESLPENERNVSDIRSAFLRIVTDSKEQNNRFLKQGIVSTITVNEDFQISQNVKPSDFYIVDVDNSFEDFLNLNESLKYFYGNLSVGVTNFQIESEEFLESGTYEWTVPEGVTDINVVAIGAGGGGSQKPTGGSGGGGGTISYINKAQVVPGEKYTIVVGQGGESSSTIAAAGGDTYMVLENTNNTVVYATGGAGGDLYNWTVDVHPSSFKDVPQDFDYSIDHPGIFQYTLVDPPPGFVIDQITGIVTYSNQNINFPSINELTILVFTPNGSEVSRTDLFTILPDPIGQVEFTVPGTYTWVAPLGVTSVCAVCVGAGGGAAGNTSGASGAGGGGLGWRNNIPVVPGQSYTVQVGAGGAAVISGTAPAGGPSFFIDTVTVAGLGGSGGITTGDGNPAGGGFIGDGGGRGGAGGNRLASTTAAGGGGGAGGYTGDGGAGGNSTATSGTRAANARGGGGGGGGRGGSVDSAGAGGGVGIYGQGLNGLGGINSINDGGGGFGGSNGTNATNAVNTVPGDVYSTVFLSSPGLFGGGGAGADNAATERGPGGNGAVRIIWGSGRGFPLSRTADE